MTYIPVRDHNSRNGHYARPAPVVRLHSTFRPPVRRPRTWREMAFDIVFRFGLPLLALVFFVLAVLGLVYLIAALGRAVRVLSGGA